MLVETPGSSTIFSVSCFPGRWYSDEITVPVHATASLDLWAPWIHFKWTLTQTSSSVLLPRTFAYWITSKTEQHMHIFTGLSTSTPPDPCLPLLTVTKTTEPYALIPVLKIFCRPCCWFSAAAPYSHPSHSSCLKSCYQVHATLLQLRQVWILGPLFVLATPPWLLSIWCYTVVM